MEQVRIYRMLVNDSVDVALEGDTPEDTTKSIGMYRVAGTDNPAILTKGMFFDDETGLKVNDGKQMFFSNQVKMRVAAPVAIPNMLLERNDKDGKFFVYFTEDDIEKMYHKFMKNLKTTDIFQVNHTDNKSNSFLFETLLLDTEAKVRMVKEDYNIDVPKGSVLMVQQYKDEKSFQDAVIKGHNGFSLEGIFDLLDVTNEVKNTEQKFENINNDEKIKNKTKNMKKVINDKFIMFEGVEVGSNVYNIEDKSEKVSFETEDFKVEDGVITEVKTKEVEPTKLEASEDNKDTNETSEEVKPEDNETANVDNLDDKVEDTAKATGLTVDEVNAMIQDAVSKVYEALAEIKASNLNPTVQQFNAQSSDNVSNSRLNNITGSTSVKVKVENK